MEVNWPLSLNEKLLLSSDTPSLKRIRYGMSAIIGLSTTSAQSKSHNKLQDLSLKAITRQKLLMVSFISLVYSVQPPPLCAIYSFVTC